MSVMPLLVLFVRARALSILCAFGRSSWETRSINCCFFADAGYDTSCATRTDLSRGTVSVLRSKPGCKKASSSSSILKKVAAVRKTRRSLKWSTQLQVGRGHRGSKRRPSLGHHKSTRIFGIRDVKDTVASPYIMALMRPKCLLSYDLFTVYIALQWVGNRQGESNPPRSLWDKGEAALSSSAFRVSRGKSG